MSSDLLPFCFSTATTLFAPIAFLKPFVSEGWKLVIGFCFIFEHGF